VASASRGGRELASKKEYREVIKVLLDNLDKSNTYMLDEYRKTGGDPTKSMPAICMSNLHVMALTEREYIWPRN